MGDFYSGRLRNLGIEATIKPSNQFLIGLEVDNIRLKRDETAADIANDRTTYSERWIPRLRLNYSFSTELFLSAYMQMNANRDEPGGSRKVRTLVSNLLFAYRTQQGHTFFIAYNQFSDDEFDLQGQRSLRLANQALVMKFAYLITP